MKKGNLPVGPGEMSEVFADYFGIIYNSVVTDACSQHQRTIAMTNLLNITYDNVYSALYKLNVLSTPGGDGVHLQILRSCAGFLAYPLIFLFERSLRSGDISSTWKWSVVVPSFKSCLSPVSLLYAVKQWRGLLRRKFGTIWKLTTCFQVNSLVLDPVVVLLNNYCWFAVILQDGQMKVKLSI